jgi:uncharacterized LabA/DUF88 family protein
LTGARRAPYVEFIPPLPLCRQGAEPQELSPAAFAFLQLHDALPKANVYVDGFNLYAGTLYKTKGCKWLNLRLLAEQLYPDLEIQTIKYFTAEISADPSDPGASGRQRAYWRALHTDPDLVIIKGKFFSNNKRKPLANPLTRGNCAEPDCPKGDQHAIVRIIEEKMSDVNLATHLLKDGFLDLYDVAIVVTNDTDLCEPIRVVRDTIGKETRIVRPVSRPGRVPSHGLQEVATKIKDITKSRLAIVSRCQYPNNMTDSKGAFYKPRYW